MDKETVLRTIIAIGLCMVFFFIWNVFFGPKPLTEEQIAAQQAQTAQQQGEQGITQIPDSAPVQVFPATEPIVVTSEHLEVGFDPNTGDIRYAAIHSYTTDGLAPRFMRTDRPGANYATFNTGVAVAYENDVQRLPTGETLVTFTGRTDQVDIIKKYILPADGYEIPISIQVVNKTGVALSVPISVTFGPGMGEGFEEQRFVFTGPIIGNRGDFERKAPNSFKRPITLDNPQWGAYTSKYFLFSLVSDSFARGEITTNETGGVVSRLSGALQVPASGSAEVMDSFLYIGPKYLNVLSSFGVGLHRTIDFGMFFFLGIPMTKFMNFVYRFVHNYGIAIIILTIIVKIITLPLTIYSTGSMRAMADLQPKLKELQAKYADDPQRLNAATMELYKANKVNPMSGCFPLLIQLPIFVALYRALLVSIELKGAPFFGWIVDLSAKDPYYITPIIMGASMFLTQLLTPSAMDKNQQRIMLIMPIVFTFLFLNFPAGLVVYWLVNNILSIIQQLITNKLTKRKLAAKAAK